MPSGRLWSTDSLLTSTAGAILASSGVPGNADLANIFINNVANGATATTFTIQQLCNDGVYRNITTLSGPGSAAVTVPNAVPTVNGQGLSIQIPGPITGLQITLGGASPTGNIYMEINLSQDRAQ